MTSTAAVKTEPVAYQQGDTALEGFLVYDDALTGKRPGVLVVHEWFGITPYEKGRAEQLARLGYVAFVADIYGKGVHPKNRDEAGAQAQKYRADRPLLRQRATAGLEVLKKNPHVDPARTAAIGFCFGGGTVLELARSGAEVTGVVSFHGNLDTPNPGDAKAIKAKVLVLHGADDPTVSPEQLTGFEDEMRKAGVDWQLNCYGGAVHGFSNPEHGTDKSKGVAYDAKTDRRAWDAMKLFFRELFGEDR